MAIEGPEMTDGEGKNLEAKENDLLKAFEDLAGRAPRNCPLEENESEGLFAGFRDEKVSVSWGDGKSGETITLKQGGASKVKGELRIIIAPPVWEQIALMVEEKGNPKSIGVDISEIWSYSFGVSETPVLQGNIPFNKAEGILLKQAVKSNPDNNGKSLREIGADLRIKNQSKGKMDR